MSIAKYVKAATDRKRYQIDYTDWLDTGESVASVAFTIANNTVATPLVVDSVLVLPTGLGVQYYVSGGVDGVTYRVLARLTTNTGPQNKLDEVLMTIREPQ
jgi:hypothetical protein